MLLGYNTNGFAHHRLEDALTILADLGYQSVAITLDYQALNPFDPDLSRQVREVRGALCRERLEAVIETGARFLLDPRRKHQPTLLDPDSTLRERRREFLERSIHLAAELGTPLVSFWSGAPVRDEPRELLLNRLADECRRLSDLAASLQVRLAFESEPGMLVATLADFKELEAKVRHPAFGLTIDIGHLHCQQEDPIPDRLLEWKHLLWNVHLEDMRRGVHDHLMFGEGDMDFPPLFEVLRTINFQGGVHVELSRHSHDAVNTARRALAFLRELTESNNDRAKR
jgi:sugar phosphate isomerase/epimerase